MEKKIGHSNLNDSIIVLTISSISQPSSCNEGHTSSIKCAAVPPPWTMRKVHCTCELIDLINIIIGSRR
jgi:hypothetical protein